MFNINKPFTTRDGREVRILCTDGPGDWPIVGIVGEFAEQWTEAGTFYRDGEESDYDLINTPPKSIDLGWVAVNEEEEWVSASCTDKWQAEQKSNVTRHLSFVDGKIVDDTEEME